MRLSLLIAAAWAACMATGGLVPAWGEDFRIETKVFRADEKAPLSQTVTLFRAGVMYDYLADPPRVAVFDKPHGRFVLLDVVHKQKTEIKTDQVTTFCDELRNLAVSGPNSYLKFMGNPQFEPVLDDRSGELTMSSEFVTYKVQTTPAKSAELAHQVREFSDWYMRLNTMTQRGARPPFARLAVNEELDQRGLVATQVHMTLMEQGRATKQPIFMRSEHAVAWRLLPRDLDRISETGNQLANFRLVTYSEFMQPRVTQH